MCSIFQIFDMNTTTLVYDRPADLPADLGEPDLEVSTLAELVGGEGRTQRVHAMVVARISTKAKRLINATAPGETVKLARDFSFDTLELALDLVYAGLITVTHDEAEDIDDIICCWRAEQKLHRVVGPQPQAED